MRVRYSFSSRRTGHIENIEKQREKYPDLLEKLIAESDVIIQVLDARFIKETRNQIIEKRIKENGKVLINVINKADLADIRKIDKNLLERLSPYLFVSCRLRQGKRKLIRFLMMTSRKIKNQDNMNVAVIGYPNTGKSTLINFLTSRASAGTGKESGFTKGIQKIRLAKGIMLIDSPGVIPKEEYSSESKKLGLKLAKISVKNYNSVKNPEIVVAEIMKSCPGVLENFYQIDSKQDVEILIEEFGKRKRILKKHGLVDTDKTARFILKDWQQGKIRNQ